MFPYTTTYEDYNGETRTETFYFNLTEAELATMEFEAGGGLSEKLRSIVEAKKVAELARLFEDFILRSYGEKSDDGRRFMKNEEIREGFKATPVYSELYMKMASDDVFASKFIQGVIPKPRNESKIPAPVNP